MARQTTFEQELSAIKTVLETLEPLDDPKRSFVLRTVTERLQINGFAGRSSGKDPGTGVGSSESNGIRQGDAAANSRPVGDPGSPKAFMKAKKPTSEMQRIVCLAYFLTHYRDQPNFKTQNLTALNTEAAGVKFSNPAAFVDNATRQSKLLAPSIKGHKQITTLGDEIVEALPNQEAVKAIMAENKMPGRRGPARKKSGTVAKKRGGK